MWLQPKSATLSRQGVHVWIREREASSTFQWGPKQTSSLSFSVTLHSLTLLSFSFLLCVSSPLSFLLQVAELASLPLFFTICQPRQKKPLLPFFCSNKTPTPPSLISMAFIAQAVQDFRGWWTVYLRESDVGMVGAAGLSAVVLQAGRVIGRRKGRVRCHAG